MLEEVIFLLGPHRIIIIFFNIFLTDYQGKFCEIDLDMVKCVKKKVLRCGHTISAKFCRQKAPLSVVNSVVM